MLPSLLEHLEHLLALLEHASEVDALDLFDSFSGDLLEARVIEVDLLSSNVQGWQLLQTLAHKLLGYVL